MRAPKNIQRVFIAASILAASAAASQCATAKPASESNPARDDRDESVRFGHALLDTIVAMPSPVTCAALRQRIEAFLNAFEANRTRAEKCLGCPIYYTLSDGTTEVFTALHGISDGTAKKIMEIVIQKFGTKEDPPGVLNVGVTKVCTEVE